jgi:dipeptidyl aminopeptidase/acylaminoacyl peptidase
MNSRRQELLIRTCARFALFLCAAGTAWSTDAAETNARPPFSPADVFELEFASDPQISPDGSQVAYLRNSIDIMTDKVRSRLWIVGVDGREHRPLTDPNVNTSSPRWSPDGKRLAYAARGEKATQVFVRWMDSGQTARLTNVTESPGEFVWSPDGQQLAFSMLVLDKRKPYVEMPAKPEGAAWAEPFKLYDTLVYRDDGRGYVKEGFYHLFVLPADGGTPRQITSGSFHHRERPAWTADGKSLVFAANRRDDWEYEPLDSDLYRVTIADGAITQLTDRRGTDASPVVSPDGRKIAFVGFDDAGRSHHQIDLYVMSLDGTDRRCLTSELDRDVADPSFAHDGKGIFFQYDDEGNTRVGYVSLATGKTAQLAADVGGVNFGRPYASGSYSAAYNGRIAFTQTDPTRPADVATAVAGDSTPRRLTHLNDDLLPHRELGRVESFRYKSSYDQQPMHGWIVTPPGFDPQKQYPLILEIHGGPFANYGGRFSVEMQLYAAAGYVVVYVNPRGSTSYGDAFTAFIDHNYPSHDYDDLMSGVDAAHRPRVRRSEQALRHRRQRGRNSIELDHRQDRPLSGCRRDQAGHQLVQLRADVRSLQLFRPLLVRQESLGRPRGLSQALAPLARRQREDAHAVDDRRSRLSHAHFRSRAVLPGAETSQDRHRTRPRPRLVPRHRRPPEPDDRQVRLHPQMVRKAPGPGQIVSGWWR